MRKDFIFGMNIHNNGYEAYPQHYENEYRDLCKDLGMDIIRFNFNPTDEETFEYAIHTAKFYKNNGFKFMLCMDYPWWEDKTEEEFYEYFKTVGSRMRGYVDYYQIFNEIDVGAMTADEGGLYNPGDGLIIDNYNPRLVKKAITAVKGALLGIKEGDPDAETCINFSWWHTKLLELFDENGCVWDVTGLDWYSEMEDISSVTHLLAWLERRFPGRDVLFCECNWRTFTNQHDIVVENGKKAVNKGYTAIERDALQAVWISDFMNLLKTADCKNLRGIILYELVDQIAYGENHAEAMYGFMRCERNGDNKIPKTAYLVLKNKIAELKKEINK